MKNDHRSKFSNLSNWKEEARKKKKNQGFNGIRTRDLPVTGALLYQLSYEAKHWERGQLYHADNSKRYFLVCHLKIVFNFLHELKKRSSDVTGRH